MDSSNQINKTMEQNQVDVGLFMETDEIPCLVIAEEEMDAVLQTEVTEPNVVEQNIPTDEEDELLNSQPKSSENEKEKVKIPGVQTNPVSDRVKLSGAARIRLRKYLNEGIDIDNARRLCQMPMREARSEVRDLLSTRKRVRSDGSTPPEVKRPSKWAAGIDADGTPRKAATTRPAKPAPPMQTVHKPQQQEKAAPSYKDAVSTTKIGVIPPDFPKTRWSDEQLRAIQQAVLGKIVELRKGVIKPSFSSCTFKPGWLVFVCRDNDTVEWLGTHVPTLKPWNDAELKVVAEDDVPKARIVVGYFPEQAETSNEMILGLLEGQNTDLSVGYWKVLKRIIRGGIVELTISIDPISADVLQQKGHRVNYGYGSALVRPTRPQTEVERGVARTVMATTSANKAKSDNGAKLSTNSSDDKPCCSKGISKPSSFSKPAGNTAKSGSVRSQSDRPRKWERSSTEESALLNSNRGRKVAKRAIKHTKHDACSKR